MVNAVRKLHTFGFFKIVSRPDAYDRLSRCFWRSETATLVSTRFFGSWSDGGGGAAAAAATSSSWSSLGFGRGFSSSQSGILIKALRERTGAPIKDVKAVLEQCGWDSEAAFVELRKKGLSAASKKTTRVAAEGLLAVAKGPAAAAVVEINSETDFVARNDIFQHLAVRVARAALSLEPHEGLVGSSATAINLPLLEAVKIKMEHSRLNGEATVQEAVAEVAAIMGENVRLRRGFTMSSSTGIVSSYLHASQHPEVARIVGLVTLEPEEGGQRLEGQELEVEVGASLAMHVVAAKPLFLSKELVAGSALQQELDIFRSQALATGKPAAVVEKMLQGRLRKYIEEVALLEQKFVVNDSMTVRAVLDQLSKQLGRQVSISRFLRMEVGEGIQREEKNFATEVAQAA
ncbi:hypothetical protein CY35_15G043500 [Sphagnum magellanicum]|nr:hypothetical protein CY35_15G043500 [Sphagnum magellanicum]